MSLVSFVRPGSRARIMAGDIPHWVRSNARAWYITSVCLSAPPWVDIKALLRLRDNARAITEMTGIPHVLDHIVPLNHPRVCGLTVPWNLEIKTARLNGHKANHWDEDAIDQLELFA